MTKMSKNTLVGVFVKIPCVIVILIGHLVMATPEQQCRFACQKVPPKSESSLNFGQYRDSKSVDSRFKVLVWNIFKSRLPSFEREFEFLSRRSDFLLLQEVKLTKSHKSYFESLPFGYNMSVSFLMTGKAPTGVATGSKIWPLWTQHFRTEDLEPFVKSPKTSLVSVYKMRTQKNLMIVNIHGINWRSSEALQRQLEQVEVLIQNHRGPLIFAGDFNTRNDSRVRLTDQFMINNGLIKIEFANDERAPEMYIDHVYYRGLTVVESQLITDLAGSDHPALALEFGF